MGDEAIVGSDALYGQFQSDNAHGIKRASIHYRWHPFHGLAVRLLRARNKNGTDGPLQICRNLRPGVGGEPRVIGPVHAFRRPFWVRGCRVGQCIAVERRWREQPAGLD
jgi:hypothetical protein